MSLDLATAKEFLNLRSTTNDAEVSLMLGRATAILARQVGPLGPTVVTDEVHTGPGPLVLDHFPVLSVVSATSGGLPVTDLDVDTTTGEVFGSFGYARRGVRVTYVAGRATVPPDLEAAALELLRHLWATQRGGSSARPSFPGETDEENTGDTSGFLLPYRVQSLLEPHKLPPAFG